jgi:hypothetical protein
MAAAATLGIHALRAVFLQLTRAMGIYEAVPLQPQVPSSKEGSVSLITSITLQASQLYLMRHRQLVPRGPLSRGASSGPLLSSVTDMMR